jgi:hypothetical protein
MFRKRNRILKRLVLGFAVAALVVPSTALAGLDEGGAGQQGSSAKAGDFGMPRAMPSDYAAGAVSIENVRLNPRGSSAVTGDIENVRLNPRGSTVSGDIENVRVTPRGTTATVVSTGYDWGDVGVLGAAILFGVVLLGGAAIYGTRYPGEPQTA